MLKCRFSLLHSHPRMTTQKGKEFKQNLLAHFYDPAWKAALEPEFEKPYFNELCEKLSKETEFFPPIEHVFEAFNFAPLDSVRVVIIGQGKNKFLKILAILSFLFFYFRSLS